MIISVFYGKYIEFVACGWRNGEFHLVAIVGSGNSSNFAVFDVAGNGNRVVNFLECRRYSNCTGWHGKFVVRYRNFVLFSVFYGKYIEFVACGWGNGECYLVAIVGSGNSSNFAIRNFAGNGNRVVNFLESSRYSYCTGWHSKFVVLNRNGVVFSVFYGKYIEFVVGGWGNVECNRFASGGCDLVGGNCAIRGRGNRNRIEVLHEANC